MTRSFLILHGWQGNTEDHWQSDLSRRLTARGETVAYPELPDADHPRLSAWLPALGDALAGGGRQSRALLVAPPSDTLPEPELASFFPAPAAHPAHGSRLVCADDDPYCPGGAAERYGASLGLPVDLIPGGAHLNPEAGYGPWPEVEAWCLGQASAVTSSRTAPG
jgi:predicted alpha/beta hydrolase family esterase